ncbi:tyrosine-type recombinase/integrase [Massilia sp. RP-1-19]|uniref:Tyrosine-type recombinase/integrase n=1 Tax=Massilia polaris TaxID=2728846 RepID=A0A848HR69_9BURK|nr:integrase arm-type DNA-binding domain-containing protein [Massilia polaris]NML62241.1 tyrosine-type recombinase/integrase [Massilia polaris]
MRLTDIKCRQAKPGEKLLKLSDSGGLQLHVFPAGSKLWRGAYRYNGKQKTFAMGAYPALSLQDARETWKAAKAQLVAGIDPTTERRVEKLRAAAADGKTFEQVAIEWRGTKYPAVSKTGDDALHRVTMNIFPDLGLLPIASIDPPMVLASLRRIEARGSLDMTKRVQRLVVRIFNYAIASGLRKDNPGAPVGEALKGHKAGHFASIDVEELPQFLVDLAKAEAELEMKTRTATRLVMHTFVRTEEIVGVPWSELDLDKALWEIPAERMKMKRGHIVPLSRQAVALFRQMEPITGGRHYVFAHRSKSREHMDNNTILRALGRMGYKGKMTGHGFRSLAMSAITQQLGYDEKIVDLQLAHVKENKTDQAYDRAKWLKERTRMMQDWSDYIDKVAATGVL